MDQESQPMIEGEPEESGATKKLTANQKKRAKNKAKKEVTKQPQGSETVVQQPEERKEEINPPTVAQTPAPAASKGKKQTKGRSAIAKLAQQRQEQLAEQQRQMEEEQKRQEELERKRLEEEERKKKLEEEEKLRQIELEEKLKKEQLTKQQQEALKRAEEARQQFINQGLIQVDNEGKIIPMAQNLKPQRRKERKNKGQQKQENENKTEEQDQQESQQEEQKQPQQEEEEDWETQFEGKKEQKPQKNKNQQDKNQNEMEETEEQKQKQNQQQAKKQEAKPPQNQPAKKKPVANKPLDQVELRSPIICILGHVDTGKTKLLDKIRHTNVQVGEAGGITQQIGATYFPPEALDEQITKLQDAVKRYVPGLLIIDTPGHESFTNLRSRGSSLCDFAILVIDLMHGLENQTLESMQLLKQRNINFVVALNKIDRCYEWKAEEFGGSQEALKRQQKHTLDEFRNRTNQVIVQLAEKGYNSCLYWETNDPDFVQLVPTSAITGEGIPDLLNMIIKHTQSNLQSQLEVKQELQATVMEIKVIEGLGPTIDVILVQGTLKEGDTIILTGLQGPIVSNIRALLTPQPMKEMRVKGEYIHHKQLKGAMGVKICGPGLEGALAGSPLYVAENESEIEDLKEEAEQEIATILNKIELKPQGIFLQSSTLGSLEALLEFFRVSQVPIAGINIGPVYKKDVLKVQTILENEKCRKEYASILAFDVKVIPEAQEYADKIGVKIFTAEIIYHLHDQFIEYRDKIRADEKAARGNLAVFPCILKIVQIFHTKSPLIIGVDVVDGVLKIGTPLAVPDQQNLYIGRVESIEKNGKPQQKSSPNEGSVAIRMKQDYSGKEVEGGKSFLEENQICSKITRESIDALKEFYSDEMTLSDWKTVKLLKKVFGIM